MMELLFVMFSDFFMYTQYSRSSLVAILLMRAHMAARVVHLGIGFLLLWITLLPHNIETKLSPNMMHYWRGPQITG